MLFPAALLEPEPLALELEDELAVPPPLELLEQAATPVVRAATAIAPVTSVGYLRAICTQLLCRYFFVDARRPAVR
jgi:hypothetical protein